MAIIYEVNYTDQAKSGFLVKPNQIDGPGGTTKNTSLSMHGIGRLAYGERINENFLHLLENFASPEHTMPLTEAILNVDNSGATGTHFIVINADFTNYFPAGYGFLIVNSNTGTNDGSYSVVSTTFDNNTNKTTIIVAEAIPSNTAPLGNVQFSITEPSPDNVEKPWIEGQLWHNTTDDKTYVYKNIGSGILQWREIGFNIAYGAIAPLNPKLTDLWYDTTINKLKIYANNQWEIIGLFIESGTTAPTNPAGLDLWYDSSINQLKVYANNQWESVADRYVLKSGDHMSGDLTLGGTILNPGLRIAASGPNDLYKTGAFTIGGNDSITFNSGTNLIVNSSDSTSINANNEINLTSVNNTKLLAKNLNLQSNTDINMNSIGGNLNITTANDINLIGTNFVNVSTNGNAFFKSLLGNTELSAKQQLFLTAIDNDLTMSSLNQNVIISSGNNMFLNCDDSFEAKTTNGILYLTSLAESLVLKSAKTMVYNANTLGNTVDTHLFQLNGNNTFQVKNNGVLYVFKPQYENFVIDNNDIPNKKYIDDAINALGGSSTNIIIGGYAAEYTGGYKSTTAIMYPNNTTPLVSEGANLMNFSYTPKDVNTKIYIEAYFLVTFSSSNTTEDRYCSMALFENGSPVAFGATYVQIKMGLIGNKFANIKIAGIFNNNDLNTKNFQIRFGKYGSGSVEVNSYVTSPGQLFGFNGVSHYTVTEYK